MVQRRKNEATDNYNLRFEIVGFKLRIGVYFITYRVRLVCIAC
jgi:hypothetical protein